MYVFINNVNTTKVLLFRLSNNAKTFGYTWFSCEAIAVCVNEATGAEYILYSVLYYISSDVLSEVNYNLINISC